MEKVKKFLSQHKSLFIILIANNLLLFFVFNQLFYKRVSEIDIVTQRETRVGGNYADRGTLILRDLNKNSVRAEKRKKGQIRKIDKLEIGFYRSGTGLFTDSRFEFWTGKSVSIANHKRTPNLEIRDKKDRYAGMWFNGNGEYGTAMDELKIHVGGWNGDRYDYPSRKKPYKVPEFQFRFDKNGNFHINGDIILNGLSLKKSFPQPSTGQSE